jgi:hypothetical protein
VIFIKGSASFLKKRLAAREAKNFWDSGPGAVAAPTPMAQSHKVFLVLFLQKKNNFTDLFHAKT